jgi:D-alanine-D-alanine ligase
LGQGGSIEFKKLCIQALDYDECLVIEEWLEGPELTVPVLQGKAMPVVEIRPHDKFYNYESKYTAGKTDYLCPAPLLPEQTEECQRLAEKAFEVLECRDYGRVDFILGKRGPVILEMNTLPGMTGTSLVPKSAAAMGLDYAAFVEALVCSSYDGQMSRKPS